MLDSEDEEDDDEDIENTKFYRDYLQGTNMIVYVVNSSESYQLLRIMCKSIQKNMNKTLVVYNIPKVSQISRREIKAFFSTEDCRDKFEFATCSDIVLPDNETKLAELVNDSSSYWSRRSIYSVLEAASHTQIVEYSNVRYCRNLYSVIGYHPLLEMVSKSLCDPDFSIVEELEDENKGELTYDQIYFWNKLEKHIKERHLNSLDYKIGLLNEIIKMIIADIKKGIATCGMIDPKYFGKYANQLVKCVADIDALNDLLDDSSNLFKIPYFGRPNASYTENAEEDKLISEYHRDYLYKVAQKLNPSMDEHLTKQLVVDIVKIICQHYNPLSINEPGINSKLVFYCLVKLLEKSLRFRKIK